MRTIAEALGIVVQASDELEGSFSGCLLQAGASFGILYSTGIRNKGYQRFTEAHELGHFSLTDQPVSSSLFLASIIMREAR